MITFARSDNSLLSRWWWTVDRWLILALLLLISAGFLMTFAASTAVAERLNLQSLHFVKRQAMFILAALGIMFGVSLMSERGIRRLAVLLLPVAIGLMVLTLFIGPDIKGATRWLSLGSFTIQPSEFLKPVFVVAVGWMFAEEFKNPSFPGRKIALVVFTIAIALLVMQPDFGQTALLTATFIAQFILAGLPLMWLGGLAAVGIGGSIAAYLLVPHVQSRIDRFLDPASGDTYQIDTALNAFRAGGLFGRGPGEGAVKKVLPDAHTDFIFAVAGEEFGTIACIAILSVFAVIVIRGLAQLMEEENPFILLAASGLLTMFGLQAIINIGVNLALLPSKGMTLPFISYGGSSLLALGLAMGMVLALTRKNRSRRRMDFRQRRTL